MIKVMYIFWLNRKVKTFNFFYSIKSNPLLSINIAKLNLLIRNAF